MKPPDRSKSRRYSIALTLRLWKICDHIDNAYEFEVIMDIENTITHRQINIYRTHHKVRLKMYDNHRAT